MSGVIFSLSAILLGSINYVRGTALTGVANLGAALPMLQERSFLATFLGAVDFFMVWYIVVLAIGLGSIPLADYGLPGTPALTEGMLPYIPKYASRSFTIARRT